MAVSVNDVLLNVVGSSDKARAELAALARSLSALDNVEAKPQVSLAGIEAAQRRLSAMRRVLEGLDGEEVSVELRADIDTAIAQIRTLERELGNISVDRINDQDFFPINEEAFRETVDDVLRQTQRLATQTETVMSRVSRRVTADLRQVADAGDARLRVNVDTAGLDSALGELDRFEAQLRQLQGQSVSVDLQARAAGALAEIALVRRQLQAVKDESRDGLVDAQGLRTATRAFATLGRGIGGIVDDFGRAAAAGVRAGGAFTAIGRGLSSFHRSVGIAAGTTRDYTEALHVLGGVMLAGAAPALAALTASAIGAGLALAGLATSAAAAAIPQLALLTAVTSRLTKILEAQKLVEADVEQETTNAAAAQRAAAAAEEARVQSANAVRDAIQGVATAERGVAQARQQAAQAIADAVADERAAEQARLEATREVGNAQRALADAARDAAEEVTRAIERQAEAARRLRDVMRDAARAQADAARRVADAQTRVREAGVAAYRAIEDAARRARNAALGLRQAQLGVADSQLRLEEAQLAVNEAMRAGSDAIQSVRYELAQFDRMMVDLGPAFTGGLQAVDVTVDRGGGESPEDRALRLKRALLELEQAKLNVEQASARQEDAELEVADANAESARFAREGINAYGPYRDAVRSLADAQRDAADAQRSGARAIAEARREARDAAAEASAMRARELSEFPQVRAAAEALREARLRLAQTIDAEAAAEAKLTALQRAGIAGAPGVLAALEGLRDAHERLAEARRRASTAGTDPFATLPASTQAAERALAELSAAERRALGYLQEWPAVVRRVFGGASDIIITSLLDVVDMIPGAFVDRLGDLFTNLGVGWGQSIRRVGAEILRPAWGDAIEAIFRGSTAMVSPVTEGFIALAEIGRDLAVAFMPALQRAVQGLSGWLQDLRTSTGGVEGLQAAMAPWIEGLRVTFGILRALGGILVGVFRAAIGPGNELGGTILDAARNLSEFVNSGPGLDRIRTWFERVIPMGRRIGQFLFEAFKTFLLFIEVIAPGLEVLFGILTALTTAAGVFYRVISLVVGPVLRLIAALAGLAVDVVVTSMRGLAGVLNLVGAGFTYLNDRLSELGGRVIRFFRRAFESVVNYLRSIPRRFRERGEALIAAIVAGVRAAGPRVQATFRLVVNAVTNWIQSRVAAFRDLGRRLIEALGNAVIAARNFVVSRARVVVDALVNAFRNIGSRIASFFSPIANFFRAVLNSLIDGVNWVIRNLQRLRFRVPNWVPGIGGQIFQVGAGLAQIPHLAAGGMTTGDTLARIGEAGQEVVLPLTRRVLRELGQSIVGALAVSPGLGPVGAAAGAGVAASGGVTQHFHLPPSPAAHGQPDTRHTAALLGREMRKSGRLR